MRRLLITGVAILTGLFFFGCQSSVRYTSDHRTKEANPVYKDYSNLSDVRQTVLTEAERWLGTPYCFGGETKDCIDCSAFICKIYEGAGVKLPRTSTEQFSYCKKINPSEKQPGDIVFFKKGKNINHVGIYAGSNQFIHSSSSQGVVRQSLNDDYFRTKIAGYGRVLN